MKNIQLLLFLSVLIFTACKGDQTQKLDDASQEEIVKPIAKYSITPFTPSTAFPDAAIAEYSYGKGQFSFDVQGDVYQLGVQTPDAEQKMCANSGEGQHIHLIIDNEPYAAKYTANFDYDIADGDHYLLAFLSRSYHESIKTDKANVAHKITVKDKGITNVMEITDPMIFYSRPKGTYVGKDTEKVMLDFYLKNVTLDSSYNVQADINGEIHLIDTWQPYYIEGLPMGENKITLTLVDKSGQAINTPLNPVTRVFTLKENPETKM